MLGSVARTPSHLSNPVVTFAHNFFHRLRVSVWRYYSYYYYIFSESCATVTTFSAGIGLLTAPFFIVAVALRHCFSFLSYYYYYYYYFLLLLLLLFSPFFFSLLLFFLFFSFSSFSFFFFLPRLTVFL